jgi:hypothetical protein
VFHCKYRETPQRKRGASTQDSLPHFPGDESIMRKKTSRPMIQPQRWEGAGTLTTVHQFNRRFLELLARQRHADATLVGLWAQLDDRACERAGRCPVLLIDLNFQRPEWWQRASQKVADPVLSDSGRGPDTERAVSLLREILIDARTLGHTMPRALNLVFGMASPVMAILVQMGPAQIDRIAVEEAQYLKPRWPESRSFWKGLLEAAIGSDDIALAKIHLHCLQLLGSELVLTLT